MKKNFDFKPRVFLARVAGLVVSQPRYTTLNRRKLKKCFEKKMFGLPLSNVVTLSPACAFAYPAAGGGPSDRPMTRKGSCDPKSGLCLDRYPCTIS